MASKYSIEAVFRAIDKFSSPMKSMTRSTNKFSNTIKRDFAKAQRSVRNFGEGVKRHIGIGVAALGAGLIYLGKQGIDLASNLMEVQNVVDTTFGDSKEKINQWSKTAIEAFGLSELQAKKFTGQLGAAMKSSGITGESLNKMSTDLVGLAGDFASFYNLDIETAFEKIKSGMMGQSKPLQELGINMNVANLQAFALSQGITKSWKSMSQSEQAMLRYKYLMNVSKDAQGDFAKTLSTSFANQQRVLQTKFNQKMAESMQKLIPVLIKMTEGIIKWLDSLDTDAIGKFILTLFEGFKIVIGVVGTLFKILQPISPIIFGIVAAFAAYKAIMMVAAVVQAILNAVMMANPVGLIIIAIGILIGLIVMLVQNWKKITDFLSGVWNTIVRAVIAGWNWLVKSISAAWEWVGKVGQKFTFILGPIGFVISALSEVGKQWDKIVEAFKGGDILGGILKIGGALISGLLAPIQGLLELLSNIPGLGDLAKAGAEKIAGLRAGLTGETPEETTAPITPAERSTAGGSKQTAELTIKDQTGRGELKKPHKRQWFEINMQASGGY